MRASVQAIGAPAGTAQSVWWSCYLADAVTAGFGCGRGRSAGLVSPCWGRRCVTERGTGMAPVSVMVIGAGQRGAGYAGWVRRHPDRASVVAVAEPGGARRARLAAEHGIAAGNAAADWRQLAERGRLADAVLICTQDRMHAEPAEVFAALGYHILLEKPMAPDEAACRRIVAAVEKAGVMLAVGHVMRYTPYTRAVKEIVRLRSARRHHERPAPGAGRILAPGPLLRPRKLAARGPGGPHADDQVLP